MVRGATLLLMCLPLAAHALPEDTIRPYVDYRIAFDSNYYRVKDAQQAQSVYGTGDMSVVSHKATIGLDADFKIARQSLIVRSNLSRTSFDQPQLKSADSGAALLNWEWQLGNSLNGGLSYSRARELQSQADAAGSVANTKTQTDITFSANYSIHPSWRIQAGAAAAAAKFNPDTRAVLDYEERSRHLGLQYVSGAGNHIGVTLRRAEGNYPNRLPPNDSYEQSEHQLVAHWSPGGHTFVDGQVGSTRRIDGQTESRLPTWRISGGWAVTGQTTLTGAWQRQVVNSDSFSNTQSTTDELQRVGANWQWTAKTSFSVSLQARRNTAADVSRVDRYRTVTAGLAYMPWRSARLALDYETEQRTSSADTANYRYRKLTAGVRVAF